jgi:ABC-type phosphate transport system permease subunit/ABC-type phosphate transport system auxiliary subunit
LLAHGEPSIWLTGGALAVALFMIVGLLAIILVQGASTFWPVPLVQIKTRDGAMVMGEVTRAEFAKPEPGQVDALPAGERQSALAEIEKNGGTVRSRLLRTGNFDLTGVHHTWVSDLQIVDESSPKWALVVERLTWGNFYGTPTAFFIDGKQAADSADASWALYQKHHADVLGRLHRKFHLQRHDLGAVNRAENDARLALRAVEIRQGKQSPAFDDAAKRYAEVKHRSAVERERIETEIRTLDKENDRFHMQLVAADGQVKKLSLADIDRAYPANQLDASDKLTVYLSRWGEFLAERPRESNTEGGVFPAIWGTVAMTLLMSLLVVPFGVLAALYLREYAKSGPVISAVRIAINNLAGVPSIVFGVFGYGFFELLVGGFIDGGPHQIQMVPLPSWQWWITLAVAVLVGLLAFVLYLGSSRQAPRNTRWSWTLGQGSFALWIGCLAIAVVLIVRSPFFDGFFRPNLPNPTFGRGGILWAALTLALLTLPVVIVATEESLAAVPNSLREGSFACGASKWQTIRNIVLPRAMPGIMTGMILAMARGAGEVAPLMLVGAVKLAPDLPVDGVFPYVHLDRSFMHLGYHIFDVGFQSPNSEAGRPMVFTTTLLLIAIVALLNLTAVWLRRRLRKRFLTSHF